MNLSIFINHFMILFLILSFCVGLVNLFALILLYYTKKNMIIKTITIIIALINWELLRSSSLQYLINISYNYDKIYSFDYYTGIFTFIFISFLIYTINTSTDLFFNTTSLKRKNTQLIIASIPIFLLILNRFSINSFNKISLYYVFPILFLSIILSILVL